MPSDRGNLKFSVRFVYGVSKRGRVLVKTTMTTNTPIVINTTIKTIDKQSIFDGVKYILTIVRPQWEQEKIQHKVS